MPISRPEWLYKIVDIDNLDHIQSELQFIFQHCYKDTINHHLDKLTNQLNEIDKKLIFKHAPVYVELLKQLNLYDRWSRTYFSITTPEVTEYIIHKDRNDWKEKCFGFNLPVQNCQDSYTVFYKIKQNATAYTGMPWYPWVPCWSKDDVEYELGILPSIQSAFINTSYPHCAFTNHNLVRVICTTRFHPEIFDYPFENFTSIMPHNENI
jgi:hypothetical protein